MKALIRKICFCLKPQRSQSKKTKPVKKNNYSPLSQYFLDTSITSEEKTYTIPSLYIIKTQANSYDHLKKLDNFLFPKFLIRKDEMTIKKISKDRIKKLVDNECNTNKDYHQFYNKNNLKLSIKNTGSILNEEVPIVKISYVIPKSLLNSKVTIQNVIQCLNDPKSRKEWDKSIKSYKIIEKYDKSYLIHIWYRKINFWYNERDSLIKKTDFFKNSIYYSFSSSAPDEAYRAKKNVERLTCFMRVEKIFEEQDNFLIRIIEQVDYKSNLSNNYLTKTLPNKIQDQFESLTKKLKEI